MIGLFAIAICTAIAILGFLAMRNPMLFGNLSPMNRGYYQRQVLDTRSRIALRLMGALICSFGLTAGTGILSAITMSALLDSISNGFLVLLATIFCCVFLYGIVTWILGKGQSMDDWFQQWRTSAMLGEIEMYPATTPKMAREARIFTIAFVLVVLLTVLLAVAFRP